MERIKYGGLDALVIQAGRARAVILEQGAQVLSYGLIGEPPIIWNNPWARYRPGVAVRGGIPVCWPWFGQPAWNPAPIQDMFTDASAAPLHGLARQRPWTLERVEERADGTHLEFSLAISAQCEPCWPHSAKAHLTICVGEVLRLTLCSENTGSTTLNLSEALHTYYAVSHVEQVHIEGLAGLAYLDCLDDWREKHPGAAPDTLAGITRAYLDTPDRLVIHDPGWGRKIVLQTHDSHSTVIWNPGAASAAQIDQFHPQAWQQMLCVESANLATGVRTLSPGERCQLDLWITAHAMTER